MFRDNEYRRWRESCLKQHTLKVVIKLPEETFYPICVHSSLIILEAHKPHPPESRVLWGLLEDPFVLIKGVRKLAPTNKGNMTALLAGIHAVLDGHPFPDKPRQYALKPLNQADTRLEYTPEQYLADAVLPREKTLKEMRRALVEVTAGQLLKPLP